jgi:hypothetical protein
VVEAAREEFELRTRSVLWRLVSSLLRRRAPQSARRLDGGIMLVSRKGSREIEESSYTSVSLGTDPAELPRCEDRK